MTCEAVDLLAGAFSLGAVSADEADAVGAHLATCDQPHSDMRLGIGADVVLAASLDPVAPSPALRDRLMATLEAAQQAHRPAEATRPSARLPLAGRPDFMGWLAPRVARPVALAAVVAALVFGGWNLGLQSELNQRDAALQAVASAIANGQAAFRVDGDAGRGYVVDTPGVGAVLVVADLQALSADRIYELWLIDAAGAPLGVGTFTPTQGAVAVVSMERDLAGYTTFAVTVETHRVSTPSGSPVMIGDLRGG